MPSSKVSRGVACIATPLLVSAALLLTIFANARCNLVKVAANLDGLVGWFVDQLTPDGVGLWCISTTNGETVSTRDTELDDAMFVAARALGTAALCLGAIVWLISLVTAAGCGTTPRLTASNGCLCICISILQALVFLVYKSEVCEEAGCSLGYGGKCGIAAAILWLLTSVVTMIWPGHEKAIG